MKPQYLLTPFPLLPLFASVLVACTDDSAWRNDPAVEAARNACRSQSGVDYDCVENEAVAALNPEICRLVGIGIDDMCLQAVYEAAGNPSICDRLYLQGVVPNCRAYYAQFTPATRPLIGTFEKPTLTQTPFPSYTPPLTATPTSQPTLKPSPTPLFVFDLSGYDADLYHPIEIGHAYSLLLIAQAVETVVLVFDLINRIYCPDLQRYCQITPRLFYSYRDSEAFETVQLSSEMLNEMESLFYSLLLPLVSKWGS